MIALVLESLYLVSSLVAFLVNLGLFGADEGFLVNVGMDFNIAVVRELEGVLCCVSLTLGWLARRCESHTHLL